MRRKITDSGAGVRFLALLKFYQLENLRKVYTYGQILLSLPFPFTVFSSDLFLGTIIYLLLLFCFKKSCKVFLSHYLCN